MPPFRSKRAPYYDKSGFSCGTATAFYALFTELPRSGFLGNRASGIRNSRNTTCSRSHPYAVGPATSEVFTRGLVFAETHLTCSGGPDRAALPVKRSKPNQATAAPRTIATAGKGMKGSTAPTMSNPVETLMTLSTSRTNPFFATRAASRALGC
jgi:hypothetical protein